MRSQGRGQFFLRFFTINPPIRHTDGEFYPIKVKTRQGFVYGFY